MFHWGQYCPIILFVVVWCLTPLSTIFQLCCVRQFYWRRKPENPEKTTASHWQTLSYNVVHLGMSGIRTHNISGDRHRLHSPLIESEILINYYSWLSVIWTFFLWCVQLIKSGSLNWSLSTKILGQFVTLMRKYIGQSDEQCFMTSPIKKNPR